MASFPVIDRHHQGQEAGRLGWRKEGYRNGRQRESRNAKMVEIGEVDASIARLKVGFQILSGRESLLYPMHDLNPAPPSGILSAKRRKSARICRSLEAFAMAVAGWKAAVRATLLKPPVDPLRRFGSFQRAGRMEKWGNKKL